MISDINIKINRDLCFTCGRCVERCIMDNIRMYLASCRSACPIHMNCQGYVRLTVQGKSAEAAVIRAKSEPPRSKPRTVLACAYDIHKNVTRPNLFFNGGLILRHLLPNLIGIIIVEATLDLGYAIIEESGLSFLGFGIQPPTPSWGNLLSNAQDNFTRYPWLAIFPGMMIFLTIISVNYIGDGLRDAFDPYKVLKKVGGV